MTESTATSSFQIARRPLDLRFRTVRLAARQWVTPAYVRVRLEGADLRGFDSPGCDDHIRVFFPELPPESIDEMRAAPSREYTPLAWDPDDGWLDLEFALHGDAGVGAAWAATAEIGSVVGIGGPRGSAVLTGRPDGWLLAGDETAVPAIRRFAHLMDASAVGRVLVEVPSPEREIEISAPPGVVVEYTYRGAAPAGTALSARLDALDEAERPPGAVFGFIAAEQSIVRAGRRLLFDRWHLDPERAIVKGYWKRGEPEYHAPH